MVEQLLYLFGAGASAKALPIVKDSPDGTIHGLAKSFKGMAIKLKNEHPHDGFSNAFVQQMNKNLTWLQTESETFQTIDTYAKYLYLSGKQDDLRRLKITVSAYFALEQLYRNKRDPRYMVWLISLLESTIFPKNIKILTWNYDFQVQLAATSFREERYHDGTTSIHSPPLIHYYPPVGKFFPHTTKDYDPLTFNMVHLNGIAGFFKEGDNNYFNNVFLKGEEVQTLLNKFIDNPDTFTHLFSFAWEKLTEESQHISRRIEFAQKIAANTSILIVIGYSFPFFNREIDKQIFEVLKESGKLKTIYCQDPFLDGSFLYNQFDLDQDKITIKHIPNCDAFHIPFEF